LAEEVQALPHSVFKHPWKVWQGHWDDRSSLRLFWKTLVILLLSMAIPYAIINRIMGTLDWSVMDPITSIDNAVPFIGWSFWIYLTLYLYYPAAAWFGRSSDARIREMFAFHQALFILTWIIFLIFIFLPTEIYIRDHIPNSIQSGIGWNGFWYGTMMHTIDTPYNAWPSLHVVQSLLIVLVLRRWNVISGYKEAGVWIAWILLCLSIMTTKQHFFWDLFTGIIAGLIGWYWMCKPAMDSTTNDEWLEAFSS